MTELTPHGVAPTARAPRLYTARECALMVFAALAAFSLMLNVDPIGPVLTRPLEARFPRNEPTEPVVGIVALGGSIERIIEAFALARKYPTAKLVVSVRGDDFSPEFLRAHATLRDRLVLEWESTSTYENATVAAALMKPKPDDLWIVVTSGPHMPRAVGTFRKAGFKVHPWVVTYHTDQGRLSWRVAWHEWAGLTWYWLKGRTSAFYPAP